MKTGQKLTLDIGSHEVILTKLEASHKFTMEDSLGDEVEVHTIED